MVLNPINAVDDNTYPTQTTSLTATTIGNVTINDTLNGVAVTAANTDVSPITTGPLSIDANGVLTLAPNTPSGTYSIVYQLCEVGANPTNCDTATATVIVVNTITAEDDDFSTTNGDVGGILGNIFANNGIGTDLINSTAITSASSVTLTVVTPATPISNSPASPVPFIDLVTGNVVVPVATPAGIYQIVYQICLLAPNASICDTAIVTINVNTDNTDEIDIYNHMTPDDDGINDVFYIDGITRFPNNTVEIYNRWGVLVYQASGYDNSKVAFRGISNGRVTVQATENLPEGTYYYIIRYTNNDGNTKEKAAYLYINR